MGFNCDKLKSKCNACCCAPVPMQEELWEKVKHKTVRPILFVQKFVSPICDEEAVKNPGSAKDADHVLAAAEIDPKEGYHRCPFLTYDLKCNIYEDRPFVCREFGKESHLMMKCCYQDKEGRVRSRQEMRSVSREQCKQGEKLTEKLIQLKSRQARE